MSFSLFLWQFLIFSLLIFPINSAIIHARNTSYSIQIGAFQELQNAITLVNRLKKMGVDSFYMQEELEGIGKTYKVYSGKHKSKQEAEIKAKELKRLGLISTYIIKSLNAFREDTNKKDKAPEDKTENRLEIKDIQFRLTEDKKEIVFIYSNRFFSPTVFALEGKQLRFIVDIKNIDSFVKEQSKIKVNGRYIKQIRTHLHRKSKKLRIVLDLHPNENYQLNQFYYQTENIYSIEVSIENHKELLPQEVDNNKVGLRDAEVDNKVTCEGLKLRDIGKDISSGYIGNFLLEKGFYSSCWDYNFSFCNSKGDFDNLLIDNDDNTVTDLATCLTWQKNGSEKPLTFEEAIEYVQQLNDQRFAGYSDWRLPTFEEMASLLENSWTNEDLFIEEVFNTYQKSCWTSDTKGPERAWKANFHLGYIVDEPKLFGNSVRAVRTYR